MIGVVCVQKVVYGGERRFPEHRDGREWPVQVLP
jgi:hypothetical protein